MDIYLSVTLTIIALLDRDQTVFDVWWVVQLSVGQQRMNFSIHTVCVSIAMGISSWPMVLTTVFNDSPWPETVAVSLIVPMMNEQSILLCFSLGLSFHQTIFCANVTWDSTGITLVDNSSFGSVTLSSFVDINNTIYVALPSRHQAQVWFNGSTSPDRVLPTGRLGPLGIFTAINGDIFVDNGNTDGRVDRWTRNSNFSIPAMYVISACYSLFVDTYDRLYCSVGGSHQVIRNSYLGNINQTETVAGNGAPGSTADMLDTPRGIFVDLNMSLYVADSHNDRVQMFRRGERHGITLAGNGSSGTIDLNRPIGIILDGNGYLYIADTSNNRIVASGPSGFRCIIGCDAGMGAVNYPRTIHFDSAGNLLVMDSGTGRLLKFLRATNSCGKSSLSH